MATLKLQSFEMTFKWIYERQCLFKKENGSECDCILLSEVCEEEVCVL